MNESNKSFYYNKIHILLTFIRSSFNLELIHYDFIQKCKESNIAWSLSYDYGHTNGFIIADIKIDRRLKISFEKLLVYQETIDYYESILEDLKQ